jgi:hypothetical protein
MDRRVLIGFVMATIFSYGAGEVRQGMRCSALEAENSSLRSDLLDAKAGADAARREQVSPSAPLPRINPVWPPLPEGGDGQAR